MKSVRATTGRWSPDFDTEGNYAAYMEFEDGTPALVSNNAYGFFDTAELTWGFGEAGNIPLENLYETRHREERTLDPEEKYGAPEYSGRGREALPGRPDGVAAQQRPHPPFYGLTIVSCELGDVRQSPQGLYIYTKDGRAEIPCEVDGSLNELAELRDAVAQDRSPFPDAHWGMATLEVLLAMRQSAAERREIPLQHQALYRP